MRQLKSLGTILLTIISLTTFGQSDVTGYYSSNVADLGFFITRIQLKPDSTFKYEFYGDLMYDKGTGKYRIEKQKIIKVSFDRDSIDILGFSRTTNRPEQLLIRNNKLYEFKQNGKVLKRGCAMSRHKKYLFFGDYYMTTRKMYLKKRKAMDKINSTTFFNAWLDTVNNRHDNLLKIWRNANEFTLCVKGGDNCLIGEVADKLNLLCYPRDYYSIDTLLYKHEDLVHKIREGTYWFRDIRVAFEHENNFKGGLYKEVAHLLVINADLKF